MNNCQYGDALLRNHVQSEANIEQWSKRNHFAFTRLLHKQLASKQLFYALSLPNAANRKHLFIFILLVLITISGRSQCACACILWLQIL